MLSSFSVCGTISLQFSDHHLTVSVYLSCFHTSLPFALLPLSSVNATSSFMVTALRGVAALGSSMSGIGPNLNWIQLSAMPLPAKQRGYRFIGLTLLATWSSWVAMWCLPSCTNIAASGKQVWNHLQFCFDANKRFKIVCIFVNKSSKQNIFYFS